MDLKITNKKQAKWVNFTSNSMSFDYIDDVTKKNNKQTNKQNYSAFQDLEYHYSVEHDGKPTQLNFGGYRFMGA